MNSFNQIETGNNDQIKTQINYQAGKNESCTILINESF